MVEVGIALRSCLQIQLISHRGKKAESRKMRTLVVSEGIRRKKREGKLESR
jgi:hypothetical protein